MSEPLQISVHVEEKRYQPTQEKTVVPDWDAKTVTPDKGYALSKVTVEGMPEPTDSETFTENGTYDVGRIGTAVVDVGVELQDKTITPTEQTQTVEADAGYDGLDTVTVNPIPPEYVVPSGSVDITANGQGIDVAGKATANVNVPQGVFPSGTKVITENVTGEDVTNYAAVDVAVPGASGTKQISITANGTTTEDVSDYAEAEITVNTLPAKGLVFEDYDSDGYPHSARFVGTWQSMPSRYLYQTGALLSKITSLTIPQGCTRISDMFIYGNTSITSFYMPEGLLTIDGNAIRMANLTELIIPSTVTSIGPYAISGKMTELIFPVGVTVIKSELCRSCDKLATVIFLGAITAIESIAFWTCPVELYDFSHCIAIPTLYSVASLGHASGCVIRIPAALSDTTLGEGNGWEFATNWSALTDIVWEVV